MIRDNAFYQQTTRDTRSSISNLEQPNKSFSSSDYVRKLCYYNYTSLDLYVVDRNNRPMFIKGLGSTPAGEYGFRVRVDREISLEPAKELLKELDMISKTRKLTDDELDDYDDLKEYTELNRSVIRLERTFIINIGNINTDGFYYDENLDICLYKADTLLPKVFPFSDLEIRVPTLFKEEKEERKIGIIDIFVIDNNHYFSKLFTKWLGRIISIPIIRDEIKESGVYTRVESPFDIDVKEDDAYREYKGVKYRFHSLDSLSELGIFNNRSEAKSSDKETQERNLLLANKQYEIRKLKSEAEEANVRNAKVIADLEHDNNILKILLEKLRSRAKMKETREATILHSKKTDLELTKIKLETVNAKSAAIENRAKAKTAAKIEALKREREDIVYKRNLEILDKELTIRELRLDQELLNIEKQDNNEDLRKTQEMCKTANNVISTVQAAASIMKFLL